MLLRGKALMRSLGHEFSSLVPRIWLKRLLLLRFDLFVDALRDRICWISLLDDDEEVSREVDGGFL